jgi:hypothetical protein
MHWITTNKGKNNDRAINNTNILSGDEYLS